jgi:hypothetical protein
MGFPAISSGASDPLFCYQRGKVLEGAVKGAFCIRREKACGQLSFFQMIKDAVATDSFAAAGVVGAVAAFHVVFNFTFHKLSWC